MLYLAITLLLIDLYEGVIYIGAVKYNYVYFKYDFEHLSWFKNDFFYTLTCFRFRIKLINTSAKGWIAAKQEYIEVYLHENFKN